MSRWEHQRGGVLLRVALGLAFIVRMFNYGIKPQIEGKAPVSVVKPVIDAPTADDLCRDQGSNVAKVYFANVNKMMEINIPASQMMADGCQKASGSKGKECENLCMDGFKYEAKQFVKGGQ